MLERGRERLGDDLEHLRRAESRRGGCRQHRVERAPRDRGLEVVDEHLEVDVLAAEVAVHQRLVLGLRDDPLDQGVAGGVDERQVLRVGLALHPAAARVVGDRPRQEADQPRGRAVVGGHRQVEGQHALAEDALADRDRLVEVRAVLVELGDDDGAGHPHGGALLPEHLGGAVDTVDGGHHEERGVGGPQPGPQVTDEVGVAGGVQQVDLHPAVGQRCQRQRDRALLSVLGLVEVADGRPVLHPSGPGDGPGGGQERLHEGGLPGP